MEEMNRAESCFDTPLEAVNPTEGIGAGDRARGVAYDDCGVDMEDDESGTSFDFGVESSSLSVTSQNRAIPGNEETNPSAPSQSRTSRKRNTYSGIPSASSPNIPLILSY